MKIRNSSRITAIVLALVMLLPLISIPAFAEEAEVYYAEDFSSYAGLDADALAAKIKTNWFQTANNYKVIANEDNTYLSFPIEALIAPGSEWDTEYYLYDGYTKWDKVTNGEVVSYDPETKQVTFSATELSPDGLVLDVNTDAAKAGVHGNVSYGGKNWLFTTGEYAACAKFGDGNCIDRYAHIFFGERTFYTAEDIEVLTGVKKVGDLKAEPKGFSAAEYGKIIFKYDAMIEPGSIGTLNMQLNRFYDSTGAAQNFFELGNVDLAKGTWGGALSGATMEHGKWYEICYIIDLVTGEITGLFNGKMLGKVIINKGTAPFTINGWSISKVMKAEPTKLAGSWNVDNVQVLPGTALSGMLTYDDVKQDFENYNVGDQISAGFNGMPAYKVAEKDGSKVWELHAGINNNNPKLNFGFVDAAMGNTWTFSSDYYIPADTQTQIQIQGHNAFNGKNAAGAAASVGWGDIFVIKSQNGAATIRREGGNSGYALPYDEWFHVDVEFDFATATFDVYVNGKLALANEAAPGGLAQITSINANSIIVGKENTAAKAWATGSLYIDNIGFKKGGAGYEAMESFDLFATWNDDETGYLVESIAEMNGAFSKGDNYTYPEALYVEFDEDQYITALTLPITDDAATADKMVRPTMIGVDSGLAILEATYVVSEDAKGNVEIQLFDCGTNSWQHLAVIDTAAATVEGAAFVKGEAFTVTAVIDTDTGITNVYLNNLLVKSLKVNANGISACEWSVMKVANKCPEYAGTISLVGATINTAYAADLAENDLYLYAAEDQVELAIETIDAASIRLFAPSGLRFATALNFDVVAVASNNIKVGTLIAPADYVDAAGAFTKEALAELNYVNAYIDVQADLFNLYNGNGSSAVLEADKYFTASIVNIKEANIDRDFAAIGYIQYTVNGETVTIYSDNYATANIQAIAELAAADFADTEYADIINAYAAGLQPKY